MLNGNRGEWSEIYTLFKVLSEGRLYTGDADLNRVEELFYPIIKVIRQESFGKVTYHLNGQVIIESDGRPSLTIPIEEFTNKAVSLLHSIKTSKGAAFSIPLIETFMQDFCTTLSAKSSSKSDICIVVHDKAIGQIVSLGFSIKSLLGGDSTLFNSNKRKTNFIFEIKNLLLSNGLINEINSLNPKQGKIKARIEEIKKLGGKFEFHSMEGSIFNNNLILIDSRLPEILSALVLQYFTTPFSSIKDLTKLVQATNPIGYNFAHSHNFYEYKIKKFLADVALGMTGSTVWSGLYAVTGGYLIVKNDGDVLCYHVYNRNAFEDYLFYNTKLDTPSSTRHEFGTLYEERGELLFALNLQIRFC